MGEEEAKEPQKAAKKVEEEKKEEAPKAEKPAADEKREDKKPEEPKAAEQAPPPPPPLQEIVLKVYMHCEGCARKVRRCLKGFEGVEEVVTDCRSSKVIVKGEKADPLKVLERVQKKSHRPVELISPIPKPVEAKKPEEKEVVKVEEKKEEVQLPVITVVLGVYMHCEACAQEIKKRIQKMKGVESVEPDLKSSQVVVKGAFEPEKLADYIHKRTGKHAVIVKTEPEKEEGKEEKKEGKEEKKTEGGDKKQAKKGEDNSKDKNPAAVEPPVPAPVVVVDAEADDSKLEMRRNEFYYYQYPQNYQVYPQMPVHELHAYPPQMFSDENPNACSVM